MYGNQKVLNHHPAKGLIKDFRDKHVRQLYHYRLTSRTLKIDTLL